MGPQQDARRWTRREMPTYVEAYPRISIGAALREAGAGRAHLLWRDRGELVVGAACIEDQSRETVLLHYAADELPYAAESAGEVKLKLNWKGSRRDNARPFADCPQCPRHADVLVLRERCWACLGCHRLKYRSALLREEVRWSEHLADLEAEISVGKLAGMREPAFRARVEERDHLARRLGGKPVTANSLYLTRISTEWITTPALVIGPVT
jgi:hypothetical protein